MLFYWLQDRHPSRNLLSILAAGHTMHTSPELPYIWRGVLRGIVRRCGALYFVSAAVLHVVRSKHASSACPCLSSLSPLLSMGSPPLQEAMKREIYTNGPIACGMYSSPEFHAYTGGILKTDLVGISSHAISLIGWGKDAATGTPYWCVFDFVCVCLCVSVFFMCTCF